MHFCLPYQTKIKKIGFCLLYQIKIPGSGIGLREGTRFRRILFNRHAVGVWGCCVLPMVCSPVGAQTIGYVNIKPPFGGFRVFERRQGASGQKPPKAVLYSYSLWFRRRNGGYTIGQQSKRAYNRMAVEYAVALLADIIKLKKNPGERCGRPPGFGIWIEVCSYSVTIVTGVPAARSACSMK